MPTHPGRDSKGFFYQWGNQAKYYFNPADKAGRIAAYRKAEEQGQAIRASGYKDSASQIKVVKIKKGT